MAPVRAEPDDAAEQVTQTLRGEPLEVEELRGDWARIRTAYEYPGWMRTAALGPSNSLLLGESWPVAAAQEPLEAARSYLGAPYEWGGMTERGIDCSGLVHMAYRRTGRVVPRDADQQEAAAQPIDQERAKPGDLVCFGEPGCASHIAFWLGDGLVLHATSRRAAVVEEPLDAVPARPLRFVRL